MRSILLILLLSPLWLNGATSFYVCNHRTSNGDGSQTNPWKTLANISWTTVQNSNAVGDVSIYFCSRDLWATTSGISPKNNSGNWLYCLGDQQYNTTAAGNASWSTEQAGVGPLWWWGTNSTAIFTNGTGSGDGGITIDSNYTNIFCSGFHIIGSGFATIQIGIHLPSTNLNFITISNCYVEAPNSGVGIWSGYCEAGCHDISILSNRVYLAKSESIYMGHYSYLTNSMSNCVVRGNWCMNGGSADNSHEGDIDIKPCVYGCEVSFNIHTNTPDRIASGNCGVVIGADACTVHHNILGFAHKKADATWGVGLYCNADGDGSIGKPITSFTAYDNLIYRCEGSGIQFSATKGQNLSGVHLWNNTIWGNGTNASTDSVYANASGGSSITITAFTNNIDGSGPGYLVNLNSSGVTLANSDNNLYYATNTSYFKVSGVDKTWAQWNALGYDSSGKFGANPLFNADFTIPANSPAVRMGANLTGLFTTDLAGKTRQASGSWDVGSYLFYVSGTPPLPTNGTSATLLSFAQRRVDSTSQTFYVTNSGTDTLLGTATVATAYFTLSGFTNYSLLPNTASNITVTFPASAAGTYSDTVTLTGGGGAAVALTGASTNYANVASAGKFTTSGKITTGP